MLGLTAVVLAKASVILQLEQAQLGSQLNQSVEPPTVGTSRVAQQNGPIYIQMYLKMKLIVLRPMCCLRRSSEAASSSETLSLVWCVIALSSGGGGL